MRRATWRSALCTWTCRRACASRSCAGRTTSMCRSPCRGRRARMAIVATSTGSPRTMRRTRSGPASGHRCRRRSACSTARSPRSRRRRTPWRSASSTRRSTIALCSSAVVRTRARPASLTMLASSTCASPGPSTPPKTPCWRSESSWRPSTEVAGRKYAALNLGNGGSMPQLGISLSFSPDFWRLRCRRKALGYLPGARPQRWRSRFRAAELRGC
mmetsp:Transcript_93299/g.269462  ORF Transcript_93299/g.269462 Transcript_93299/m.269462 type:complete len:215 (+) Transcript_93299:603-1247(+)